MSDIAIRVIGSGDAFGSGGRLNTCFYVKSDSLSFLIDCGATTLPGLAQHKISPEHIDLILISHFHGDHFGGLPYFLLQAAVYGRKKPLKIVSPPGCRERVQQLLDLLYPQTEVLEKLNLEFIEFQPYEKIILGPLEMEAYPVIHNEAALPHGLRLSIEGKVISYSGDTTWTEALIELSRDADLFICECNFFKTPSKGHLNYQTLMANKARLSCKQILLTHFDNEMLEHLDELSMETAYDGKLLLIQA